MKYIILGIFLILLTGSIYLLTKQDTKQSFISPTQSPHPTAQIFKPYTAHFLIFTNNTKRVFTDSKYHNRSEKVYITAQSPSEIYVTAENVTWNDFFVSLPSPMRVTETCLTTGTGQEFCTNTSSRLKFFINGAEVKDALTNTIQPEDRLVISFGPHTDPNIENQLQEN